ITSTINGIHGAVTVNGLLGHSTLTVRDQSNFADPARSYTLTATSLTRSGSPGTVAPITFTNVENRNLFLSGGVITGLGTPAGTTTMVAAGGGNDQVFVGSTTDLLTATLDSIQGPLTVDGQGGTNYLELRDRGTTTPHCYNLTGTATTNTLTRSPGAAP